jgi:hypothetical protein
VTILADREAPPVESPESRVEAFFERVRRGNPFAANRVVPSISVKDDAREVHRIPFDQLTELAALVLREQLAAGALLWGDAGVGKSHLLARLGNWASPDETNAICIFLANLQARPEQMPRSLLRCVVSILTRGRTADYASTPLYRLVRAAVRHALNDDGRYHQWSTAESAYWRLVDDQCAAEPARAALVDRQALGVLFEFFRSVYLTREGGDESVATLAVRWLSGNPLDPDEARLLGLQPAGQAEESVAITDDEQVKRVLIALTSFAAYWNRPFILCFDQVDNLEREQFAALSRFLHALLDGASNLLVITAGVRATLFRWEGEGVFTQAARDRLGQYEIELQRIGVAEARQIVEARLRSFREPFLSVDAVREIAEADPLFPLGEARIRERLAGKVDIRPRDVITRAADEWRRQQDLLRQLGGPAWLENWSTASRAIPTPPPPPQSFEQLIDDKITLKIHEHIRQRQQEPQSLPPDAENLAGLIYTLLMHCLDSPAFPNLAGVERQGQSGSGPRPAFDLIVRSRAGAGGEETRTGLLCLVVGNRNSMSAYLRRLVQVTRPPDRVLLVTDERVPFDPATAGRDYLDQVRQLYGESFQHRELTFDRYAELEALQAVAGQARSGDLEVELPGGESRVISETGVIASHQRQGRFLAHSVLGELLEAPPPNSAPEPSSPAAPPEDAAAPMPDERDVREFIVSRIAIMTGATSKELAAQYREYLIQKGHGPLGLEECRARLEEAARRLHTDGLVNVTPHDDYLYLLNK